MLHSSHADGWMDCLFCPLSLPDPTVSLGRGMTMGCRGLTVTVMGVWCSGNTLANYILSPLGAGLSLLSRCTMLYPQGTVCWCPDQRFPIIWVDKKPLICQIVSCAFSSYDLLCYTKPKSSKSPFPFSNMASLKVACTSFWSTVYFNEVESNKKKTERHLFYCKSNLLYVVICFVATEPKSM